MLAAGAIGLTACSETEVINEGVQSNAIGFDTHVSKNSRAVTNENFESFHVYGSYTMPTSSARVQVFDGEHVTKSGAAWTYSGTRYWINNATYKFAAYGVDEDVLPGIGAKGSLDTNTGELDIDNVVVDGAAGHQKDIVYAKSDEIIGKTTGNAVVSFSFKHILSRLDFTFKSGFPEGYEATISNVRLVNVRNTGNFIGSTLEWDNVERTEDGKVPDIVLSYEANGISSGTQEKAITSAYAYVLPFEYTVKNVGIVFDIDVTDPEGNAVYGRKDLSAYWAPKWTKGNTYSYTIVINGQAAGLEAIEFTGSVADWETGTPSTPEFNLSPEELPQPEP